MLFTNYKCNISEKNILKLGQVYFNKISCYGKGSLFTEEMFSSVCIPFIREKSLGGRVWDHLYSLQNVRCNLYDGCSTFCESVGLVYQRGIDYLDWWDEDLQDNIKVPRGEL